MKPDGPSGREPAAGIASEMDIEIGEASIAEVANLADVSIAFSVDRVLDVTGDESGVGGLVLSERQLDRPYVKNYDAISGGGPAQWAARFDVSSWGLIQARTKGRRVGAAVVVRDPTSVLMPKGEDVALLWDIRVSPDVRRHGIGSTLLQAAESWAITRRCRQLKVETQNINLPACRFYARHGFVLRAINRRAYLECPDEIQLLWDKTLLAPRLDGVS